MRVIYMLAEPGGDLKVMGGVDLSVCEAAAREARLREFWVLDHEGREHHFIWFDGKYRVDAEPVSNEIASDYFIPSL